MNFKKNELKPWKEEGVGTRRQQEINQAKEYFKENYKKNK
jgi:hypothetical protein